MQVLVIGYGSIGARHARLLTERGADIACVSHNTDCPYPRYTDITAAIAARRPDVIVVANPTARHIPALREIASTGFAGRLLIEKPLGGSEADLPSGLPERTYVAFNLRFHPIVAGLREALSGRRLLTASFYAGMYLPDWRPGTDYRLGYSAKRAEGGGVLRDLSHELDLAQWLCGPWHRVAAIGGKVSDLDIETDDAFALLLATERCPSVSININYLDRMPRRTIVINAEGLTASADLITGRLVVNGEVFEAEAERDSTYRGEHDALLGESTGSLCTLAEAAAVDALVEAAQRAAEERAWKVRT